MDLHPDFKELLAECVAAKVEFVLVGGYAVGVHSKPRATKDLDLLVVGEPANLERLSIALDRFGAPANVVAAAKVATETEVLYFGIAPLRVDIMTKADGIDTKSTVARATIVDLSGLQVPVIGLDDLIANKLASGRAQDLVDHGVLCRVRDADQ